MYKGIGVVFSLVELMFGGGRRGGSTRQSVMMILVETHPSS